MPQTDDWGGVLVEDAKPKSDDWGGIPVADDDPSKPAPDTRSWWERGAVKPTTLTTDTNMRTAEYTEPIVRGFGHGFTESFDYSTLGVPPEERKKAADWGLYAPAGTQRYSDAGWRGTFYALNETAIEGIYGAVQIAARTGLGIYKGLQVAGVEAGLPGDIVSMPDAFMGSPHPLGIPKEVPFAQPKLVRAEVAHDGTVHTSVIGEMPKDADFKTAADHLNEGKEPPGEDLRRRLGLVGDADATEANLRRLWDQDGIHPAEAVHDAKNDAFLRNELTAPIEAYHGSPHDFDVFSMEHIGTGEGAQSYGHGLYFAENPEVSKTYRSEGTTKQVYNPETGRLERAYDIPPGNLYRVRIHADKEHFLDWDKPLSEQSEFVRNALENHPDPVISGIADKYGKISGEAIHGRLLRAIDQEGHRELGTKPSDILHEAGIPGIKYLDQGSRGAVGNDKATIQFSNGKYNVFDEWGTHAGAFDTLEGAKEAISPSKPTSNYVVFDDSLIQITHKNDVPFYDERFERALDAKTDRILLGQEEGEIPRRAVGAEVTDIENLPSLAEQPPPPLGTLRERATNSAHELLGMSKNLAWILDPMSQGSKRAMVLAKDTISMIRRIDWEWNRADQDIYKNFTRERREHMWNAADEESVALQLGESLEHQGLATLDPDEFTAVRREHIRAMKAWDAYVESGAVEGDGLPAYTPRMVLNVALADEHVGPRDLNRLGHDVFTRTAQMRERKHLMAEDTEAAAKELVRKSMEERGATPGDIEAAVAKVQIARDIRTVPLATARLEKAVVYRNMLNELRKIGDATGKKLVLEGEPPPGYFTIRGNPAFTTWRPMLEKVQDVAGEPYWQAVKNEAGNVVMRPEPISLPNEFEGPLRSIMDEAPSKNPLARGAMTGYDGIMMLKSKAMHVILNSPLIHGAVVWGKVFPAEPQWGGIRTIFTGRSIIRDDPVRASQLIERGLAPVGRRGGVGQDISGVMELPELQAGRGWTAQSAGLVARMFKAGEKGEIATRDFVDKAGDFMHNTLLWDRVTEAQFGLASHLSDDLVARGASRVVADRIGAHFSNMIVGAMPKEAMSAGARAAANFLAFSRSFTFGNLQMVKQAVVGLPKPIVAQIERDMGVKPGVIVNLGKDQYAEVQGPQMPENYLKSLQRRRAIGRAGNVAIGIIAVDYVVSKITNSLLQNAANVAVNDSTWDEEFHGYAQRLAREWEKRTTNPYELLSPLNLTPMSDNEPSKTNRIFMGYDKDGRAIYGKNPTGKYPEEIVDWLTGPWDTMRRKMAPFPGAFLDVLVNSDALGRKIMDKTDDSLLGMVKNSLRVAEHFVEHHLPMEQLEGLYDLSTGQGDTKVNAGRAFAPVAGFTVSRGAPGGMGKGEYYSQRDSVQAKFDIAKPALRKQIMNGDIEGAQAAMARIGMPPRDQIGYIRSVQNPNRIGQQGMQRFNYGATPEQQDRFERARERDQGARQ